MTHIVKRAGADYIKTSTGFGSRGASIEDIKIFKSSEPDIKIKASGGIRDYKTAKEYMALGINRIGTSSGVTLVKEELEEFLGTKKDIGKDDAKSKKAPGTY